MSHDVAAYEAGKTACADSAAEPTETESLETSQWSRYQTPGENTTGPSSGIAIVDFVLATLFHATVNDTLPTDPLTQLLFTGSSLKSKIDICQKAALAKCSVRGECLTLVSV